METAQKKDIQETGCQRSVIKNKPISASKTLYTKSRNDKKMSSSVKSSLSTSSNTSITSLNKNNTETTTFTPQMCALREKIRLRNLNTFNLSKKIKTNVESKQQTSNIMNKVSTKKERKKDQRNNNLHKNGIEQYRSNQKKNVYTSQDISSNCL